MPTWQLWRNSWEKTMIERRAGAQSTMTWYTVDVLIIIWLDIFEPHAFFGWSFLGIENGIVPGLLFLIVCLLDMDGHDTDDCLYLLHFHLLTSRVFFFSYHLYGVKRFAAFMRVFMSPGWWFQSGTSNLISTFDLSKGLKPPAKLPQDDGQQFPRAWRCVLQLVARQFGALSQDTKIHWGGRIVILEGKGISRHAVDWYWMVLIFAFEWI